jgi:hypothetical protein
MKTTTTTKKTVKITRAELIQLLLTWNKGTQPASIQYVTTPKLNKEGRLKFGDVTKIAAIGGLLGYDYERSVNAQLIREHKTPDFKVKPLWNGKGIHVNTVLIQHIETQKYYISYKYQQTFKSYHFDTNMNYLQHAHVKPYFPISDTGSYQGLNEAVYNRTIAIENVRKIKMLGRTYEVV